MSSQPYSSSYPFEYEVYSPDEHGSFKVYKRRWLILLAGFILMFTGSLNRAIISIADVVNSHVDITMDQYNRARQASSLANLLPVVFMARFLDRVGLRRMMYIATSVVICANLLKALCCADDSIVPPWICKNRYLLLVLSEVCVGLAGSMYNNFPAKIASVWFPHRESTLALVLTGCGYHVGMSFGNYLAPIFIKSTADINILSYVFFISAIVAIITTPLCITRSRPKSPPSTAAIISATSSTVPLLYGIRVMMSNPSFVLLLIKMMVDFAVIGVVQANMEDILSKQHYPDTLCGVIIAHAYFFGIFFSLMSAAWVDKSTNYIKVSRITSVIFSSALMIFFVSLLIPKIRNIIIVTNIIFSLGCSLTIPATTQVSIRSTASILPEASVIAITAVLETAGLTGSFSLMNQLRTISRGTLEYKVPLLTFAAICSTFNLAYAFFFRAPNKDKLQERLRYYSSYQPDA